MAEEAIETIEIAAGEQGLRLDRVLAARIPALSRSRLKALILDGQVAVAARTIRDPATHVNSGDTVTVTLPAPAEPKPTGEPIPLDIVFEDDALIVIDKPKGLVVHPAAGHAKGTLVNALIAHCGESLSGIGGVKRPGHRAPARQGHHRADGGGQDRRRPSRALAPSSPTRPKAESSAAISLWSGARPAAPRAPSTPRSTATPNPATDARCAKAAGRR